MKFSEIIAQASELLRDAGRVTYRTLKREFALDDEMLEDLKEELIVARRVARDEDGKVLVWVGEGGKRATTKERTGEDSPESKIHNQETQLPIPNSQPPVAERRQLTVMFCDLVGSTVLSGQLDPEELREVVRGYQETCTAVIRRYEGHIAQHLGDGLLVYFGYPTAHEDDAARAVRAGLEIIHALRGQDKHTPLQIRIGIHTGLVVIGEIGSSEKREMLALGETPNIAARVQGQANPDEVMISAATYRLVEGLVETEERGQPELKGVATPLTLYRVIKESEAHSRFDVVVRKGLTPLIGREHEFGLLRERWERVKDGTGQVVLLSGEPGIGKSRLVEALKETVEDEGTRFLELRCSPYTQNSALAPVIEHLQRVLQLQPAETADEKLHKVEQRLARSFPNLQETVPLFAALLSLPAARFPLPALSPQKQKEKTYEALVAWLCAEAKQQAVAYAWEDLHWADPSTLELLTLFLAQIPTTRLLAVLTYRPEFTPPWGSHSYLSQLSLSRLGRTHVEAMVEKVTGGHALPSEILQQIVSKTDGVPLFVEELTKSVVESVAATGHAPLHALDIPATLQDSLMARLDRLGAAKELAQLGATLGREFTYELLKAVSPLHEDSLQQGLKQLVDSELVYQNGVQPHARYLFKHALVQDAAYQSLLKSHRQQLHHTIGKILEEQFVEIVETQPELVAHHYTEAGFIAQAIPYWQRAGERAIQRSAHREAATHLSTGVALLKALPDSAERDHQELLLQAALGSALLVTKGLGAHEVRTVYDRARQLGSQLGDTPQLFSILEGLSGYYLQQEEMVPSMELIQQCLALAEQERDVVRMLVAHSHLVSRWFFRGHPVQSHEHGEQTMALYEVAQHRSLAGQYGYSGALALAIDAWALWHLGYPDRARKTCQAALALSRQVNHPYTRAWALNGASWLYWYCREAQTARSLADEAIALAMAQDFPHWVAMGQWMRGQALIGQGQTDEGVQQLRQGLEAYQATGALLATQGCGRAELARGYACQGRIEEGLRMLVEALAVTDKTGVRHYEAEMYRLKGEFTLQSSVQSLVSRVKKAEEYFLKAIEVAQSQQAKSWELRAATSLAHLWQQQGKRTEAHNLLSEVYNWFTEGFDTKDLQEAKVLLDTLVEGQ